MVSRSLKKVFANSVGVEDFINLKIEEICFSEKFSIQEVTFCLCISVYALEVLLLAFSLTSIKLSETFINLQGFRNSLHNKYFLSKLNLFCLLKSLQLLM